MTGQIYQRIMVFHNKNRVEIYKKFDKLKPIYYADTKIHMADVESNFTVILCFLKIRKILRNKIKVFLPFFIINILAGANKIYRKTGWAEKKDKEAKFVKSLMILSALYLELKKKIKKKEALKVMKDIIMEVAYFIDYSNAKKSLLFSIPDPFERWIRYRSGLITDGFGLYNEIEDIYVSGERIHYIVKRCVFHDAFLAADTPELTRFICDYDQTIHSLLFGEFYFDRNGSWKNTIGYGEEICHYVWKQKEILTNEFKEYLNSMKNPDSVKKSDKDKRVQVRRQYTRRQNERRKYDRRIGGRRQEDV